MEDKTTKRLRLQESAGSSTHFEERNEQTGNCIFFYKSLLHSAISTLMKPRKNALYSEENMSL